MKNRFLFTIAVALVLSVAAGTLTAISKTKSVTVTGWVSDENCGALHSKPGGEDCVQKCLRGGAHIGHPEWKPQRMVFVTDEEKKIWIVENPDALKGFEGRHIKITAKVNGSKKSVRIETAKEVKTD